MESSTAISASQFYCSPTFWWRRLRRITTSGNYIPEIDGLRFVAIMWVVLHHMDDLLSSGNKLFSTDGRLESWIYFYAIKGAYGVPFFFMISGFVLALPFINAALHDGPKVSLKNYYLRRVTRLEPPYFVALIFFFTLAHFLHPDIAPTMAHALAGLVYSHNTWFVHYNTIDLSFWSLEIEVRFYIIVPLLVLVFRLSQWKRYAVLFGAIVLADLFSIDNIECLSRYRFTFFNYAQYFLLGFFLAELYLAGACKATKRYGILWDCIGIACVAVFGLLFVPESLYHWQHKLSPFFMFLFFLSAFKGLFLRKLLTFPAITTIGGMCYSIYLVHQPLMTLVLHLHGRLISEPLAKNYFESCLMGTALIILPTLIIATVFYLLIEQPCMDKQWPIKLWNGAKSLFSKRPHS